MNEPRDPPLPRLRPTRPADLDFVVVAETDRENGEWLLAWTRDRHRASLDDDDVCHLVVEGDGGRRLGFIVLAGLSNAHGSVECRRVVITEKGRGHGRRALHALAFFVFEDLGAHRLWLDTQVRNERARHLYRSAGFVEEGVLRECWHQHGAWQSLVVMSMLETEYRAAR
jgi:RimJ/RimL family protein N-acetyltransferase